MKFTTTVIGSYPKPEYLHIPDWFKSTLSHVNIDYDNYFASHNLSDIINDINKARKEIISEQIEMGIDIISDGEITRDNYI